MGRRMVWEDDEEQELEFEDGDDCDDACSICYASTRGDDYICDRCDAFLCRSCAVPAIDDHGNMVTLCRECAEEHTYGADS